MGRFVLGRPEVALRRVWRGYVRSSRRNAPQLIELEARRLLATSGGDVAFVTDLYRDVLFRVPTSAEVDFWSNELARGVSERAVTRKFLHSRERAELVSDLGVERESRPLLFVDSLFSSLLGRPPAPSGRRFWAGVVRSGVDRERVIQNFLTSGGFVGVETSLRLEVAPTTTTHGDAVIVSATLIPSAGDLPASGTVEFFNGANLIASAGVSDFRASATTTALPSGVDEITAIYRGDGHYRGSTSAAVPVTVARAGTSTALSASPNPATAGGSVLLTANVSATSGSGTPEGAVTFFVGAMSLGTESLSSGKATLTTSAIPVGSNQVTAVYAGDSNFTSSTSPSVVVTVGDATTTTLVALPVTSHYTDTVEMTAMVTATSGGLVFGQVEFFDGTTSLGTADVDHGVAVFDINVLTGGVHTLKAIYLGDGTHLPSTASTSVTVFQVAPQVYLSASQTDVSDGEPVTFTVIVLSSTGDGIPSGTVTFFDGATALGTRTLPGVPGQEAVLTTSSLSHGTHTITAHYGGDINFGAGDSGPVVVNVGVVGTTTTVTTSFDTIFSGLAVELTATVTQDSGTTTPNGGVEFFAGTISLGEAPLFGNTAIKSTAKIPVGTQEITAVYRGDAEFGSSTSPAVQIDVLQAPSLTVVEASAAGITPGSPVTLTGLLSLFPFISNNANEPTGTMTFFDGSTELGTVTVDSKTLTFTTSALDTLGPHLISAVYSGDANFLGSTSLPTLVSVVDTTSTTVLEVTPASPTFGDTIQLTATVTPSSGAGTPTGTVTFYNNGDPLDNPVELRNGVAVASFTTEISAGSNSLTAVYSGDSSNATSTSSTVPLSVERLETTTTISISTPSSPFGGAVVITAQITTPNSLVLPLMGTVEFYAGETLLGTADIGSGSGPGTVPFFTTNIPLGNDVELTAVYVGDGDFEPSTSPAVPITITPAPTVTTLEASPTSANLGDPVTLTATVTNVGVTFIPGGSVDFYDGSTLIGSALISETTAEAVLVVTTLAAGSHSLTAVYPGSTNFETSTSSDVDVEIG